MPSPTGPEPSIGLYFFLDADPTVAPGIQSPLYQLLIRTDTTPNELYWKSGEAATAWTLVGGGGGGTGATVQTATYVATGGESDFMVTISTPMATDVYDVVATSGGVSLIPAFDCPDALAGDRTTTQFRCITTGLLTAGDTIDFLVAQ